MGHRYVADLITGRVFSLPGTATALDAARLMAEMNIGAILIVEEARLKGIFTERDAVRRIMSEGRDPGVTPLSGVMTGNPTVATPQVSAVEALRTMREGGFRHLPVVEHGDVCGIISIRDFVGAEFREVDDQLRYASL